ncbi:glucose-1-phosphate adenylyltransferase [Bacillus sp. RG28]|uniref:Glucose-1-phosphate adenylyltransferase n=1 Tax=Gottfriedia endophytica TaxID=2820819 RepID=A0A940NL67_9BACI|nr:sugar phosphate nucleotidyltransferase [Gottfriedia endophytica]MBP0726267.1 glucose-1-phosphate adenylyltransferase [Gottfriedia endophytica]
MKQTMLGIIEVSTHFESLQALTKHRPLATLPFAGRYRLIDFILSNMVNSEITSVAVFPDKPYRSIIDHLGSGKHWDLNRKRDGLFIFTPEPQDGAFGSFDFIEKHIQFLLRSTQKYVVVANTYTICSVDFRQILKRHIETKSDITELKQFGRSLNIYILEKELLLKLFENFHEKGYETIMDVVRDEYNGVRIAPYEITQYVAKIQSIEDYYEHSLKLLQPEIWKQLFIESNPIFTKVKDEPPTKYAKQAVVKNSIIANGCIIEGNVENCVISRGVKIGKNTIIRNCVVMQKTIIGDNCILDGVILDKDVVVRNDVVIEAEKNEPVVLQKGSVQGALLKW